MPRPDPTSQRGKAAAEAGAALRISRLDELKHRNIAPPMPPNPAPHFTAWLVEIGITEAAGMGAAPLSWREINAWCEGTCLRLQPWERRLLRTLSVEYLAESRRAESENSPAPYHTGPDQRAIETEQARLMAVLG